MPNERAMAALERAERVLEQMASRTPEARAAAARKRGRWMRSVGRRAARAVVAVGVWAFAVLMFGLFVGPIGIFGAFLALLVAAALVVLFATWSPERRYQAYAEQMSNRDVVHQLDTRLVRARPALPAPARTKLDAISAQLPLLEKRLEGLDPLDPLAQDARRLMGRHLPDLLDRYERVPASHRREADPEGLSVEQRLERGLDAARAAVDDLSGRLAQGDLTAFDTQRRFLESRYKDPELPAS